MTDKAEAIAAGLRKHIHPEHFSGIHPERVDVEVVDGEVHVSLVYEGGQKKGMMIVQPGTGLLKNQWHHGFVGISGHATVFELTMALTRTLKEAGIRYSYMPNP
jgi:hypothetical protein